jgi:hypothetical protein
MEDNIKYSNEFGKYLIKVGIRSLEYTYGDELLFNNIQYFKDCYDVNLSAYKALLFFSDFLKENKKN